MTPKKKILKPVEEHYDHIVLNIDCDEANADWLRASRLKKKAEQGDKEAAKELNRMHNTKMYKE